MTEGRIVSWLKNEGDEVKKGEAIVVVESDKADMDVESFNSGILGAIVIPEGEVADVGKPIGYIAETKEEIEEAKSKAGAAAAPAQEKPKEEAAPEQEAAAPAAAAAEPEPAKSSAGTATAPPPPPPPPPPSGPQPRADGRIVATPYAKKLAKELGVDLAKVGGTGPNGRITADDVERVGKGGSAPSAAPAPAAAAATNGSSAAPAAAAPPKPAEPVPDTTVADLKGQTVPFTTMQSAVAKNMINSLTVPEFRASYTITTDAFDALYKRLKPKGVTMSALLAKACGVALARHPLIFAATTPDGKGITYAEQPNIAMAVAMPDGGLITPVLAAADSTDIYQLSRNWADLVKRARAKQLSPNEYSSGNFTISNLGMFGVDTFDAVLPPGTGAILAVGASKPTVVATDDGLIGVKRQMTVNLTADHRLIYGADAAQFLQTLAAVIENPEQLTM